MNSISEYKGKLLNHLEGLYRPGEHDLVVELLEALDMAAVDIVFAEGTSPLISVHPNGEDRDATQNVMFLTEMSPAHAELEKLLETRVAADPELGAAVKTYKDKARTRPSGIPHFGVRYPSTEAFEPVLDKLRNGLSPALKERVTVTEMPPYKVMAGLPEIRQVFLYQDVFVSGFSAFGQLIELQTDRAT